jgi:hypothetical protein
MDKFSETNRAGTLVDPIIHCVIVGGGIGVVEFDKGYDATAST